MGEKFCCRVIECTIKVKHFTHCLPVTRGNRGANGTEEIMTHWPEWICNTGMLREYALFLSRRIGLWTNKTSAKVQVSSAYEHTLQNKAMMEICDIFGKLVSALPQMCRLSSLFSNSKFLPFFLFYWIPKLLV